MPTACFLIPAFGIACERARRPDLLGKPLALTSDGVVLQVVSEEAEQYGIRVGQKASGARSLCPTLALLPYDGESYTEAARPIWDRLAIESSFVEPVLPELCFVEMSGREAEPRVRALAREIARLAKSPVQAGIASSKLVARQAALRAPGASRQAPAGPAETPAAGAPVPPLAPRQPLAPAEPAGTPAAEEGRHRQAGAPAEALAVESGREAAFLSDLSLDRLPGLDRALLKRLEKLGVRTLGEILRIKPHELHRQCRQSGHLLRRLAMGEDGDRVRAAWPPRALEETLRFEVEIAEEALLCEALRDCAERLAPRLKAGSDYCRSLALDVSLEDGSEARSEERLKAPANDAGELFRAAARLLQRLALQQAVLAVRLTAGGLGAGSGLQLILLDEHGNGFLRERQERLEAALGILRKRYGEQAVVPASLLRPKRRIDLWTCALTRSADEPVEVALDAHGAPTHFWRCAEGARRYDVEAIQDRWKESDWFGGRVVDRTAYRIVAGAGLYDLHRVGAEWRLGAIAD